MDKVIKKLRNKNLTYKLGYDVWDNKIYPSIQIYKNNKLLSGGILSIRPYAGSFSVGVVNSSPSSYVNTIKELFNKLRIHSDIPEYIEKEYEDMFLLYKLNDFNKL